MKKTDKNTSVSINHYRFKQLCNYLCLLLIFFNAFYFSSCDKPPSPPQINIIPDSSGKGIFIVNEGNFTQGNASLDFLNLGLKQYYQNITKQANGKDLGDVLQSVNLINDKLYLVVNNSGKIEIIDPKTFKTKGTINGLTSPRYISKAYNNKAYISDLYDNKITVIDLLSNNIIKKIDLHGWTEEMISFDNKTYITNLGSNKIYVIDEINDVLIDSIEVEFAPKNILLDSNNKAWVLCGNAEAIDKRHFIVQLDLQQKKILKKLEINAQKSFANRLRTNGFKNTLFWIDGGIYKLGIKDSLLPKEPIVLKESNKFYGLSVDPKTNEIFASNVKDFNSTSDINRYDTNGNLLGRITGGKITSDFYF